MESHIAKIMAVSSVTHDVKRFRVEKPMDYRFTPGQATEIAINQDGWKNEKRPFTFTSLNEDDFLEFTIKIYDDHEGVTHQLGKLKAGDELILHDVWGAIQYKGPGVFIAGGAGITPFIAIFRQLNKDGNLKGNQLIFSNKTEKDIILKEEFGDMLGAQFINTLTKEENQQYDHHVIDTSYLKSKIHDFNQCFYICGPDPMIEAVQKSLVELGVTDSMVTVEV